MKDISKFLALWCSPSQTFQTKTKKNSSSCVSKDILPRICPISDKCVLNIGLPLYYVYATKRDFMRHGEYIILCASQQSEPNLRAFQGKAWSVNLLAISFCVFGIPSVVVKLCSFYGQWLSNSMCTWTVPTYNWRIAGHQRTNP